MIQGSKPGGLNHDLTAALKSQATPHRMSAFGGKRKTYALIDLAAVGKARQHHRCLELVHARLRTALGQERQWNWVQWQVSDVGWTTRWLECIRLAHARVNVV